jgi:leukotriene-A4 hydrolase
MDRSSNSNPEEAVVTHLDWTAAIDFDSQVISAEATYTVHKVQPNATKLCLDTSTLRIQSVQTANDDGTPLDYILHPKNMTKPHLGQTLEITLPASSDDKICIVYQVARQSSAVQWLPPSQTAGKKYPYLFTQCQAIHARALVPCQDRCGVKMTYTASVTVPDWATCVMSALLKEETTTNNDTTTKVFTWDQPVPISSYLIAIAVGELAKKDISPRCAIWSEPSLVEAAADEFAETEDFLKIAEDLSGTPYVWGRYDLLCLPPSFPYGGMENPCLTFVTPTLLAGDRSLADVVAHEIAHSWTGNLVTNATWDHFWLNEGWTVWFQRKIMARIKKNPKFIDFDAIEGRKHLQDAMNELAPNKTRLVLDIKDDDPDDAYSKVAYEKGFTLLLYLERLVGSEAFEAFFQAYIAQFASHTVTTEEFKAFFLKHFEGESSSDKVKSIDWKTWFHSPGMPPVLPELDQSLAKDSQDMASLWFAIDREGKAPPTTNTLKSWSSLQITCFLDALQVKTVSNKKKNKNNKPLKVSTLKAMNSLYHFAWSRNSEVLYRYCDLAIAAEDTSILPVAVRFITTQGRMKFTRPLYRALYKSKIGKDLAVSTFLKHKDFYHPICVKMVAQDLKVAGDASTRNGINPWILAGVAAAAAGVGIALHRGRK